MPDNKQSAPQQPNGLLRQMSQQDLSVLGRGSVSYVRQVGAGRAATYALFTADGTHLGSRDTLADARELAWENDLAVVPVN